LVIFAQFFEKINTIDNIMLGKILSVLNESEVQELIDALPRIGILIAGADGEIKEEEINWGAKLSHIRAFKPHGKHGNLDAINEYFAKIDDHYLLRFQDILKHLPTDTDARSTILSSELSNLNPILNKLDQHFAAELYHNFLSFAKHIARADGGVLGIGSISSIEGKWINLPMIHPIETND